MTPLAKAALDVEPLETRIAREVDARFGLTPAAFAASVRARLGPDADAAEVRLDDLYLAACCAGGDDGAWRELARRHFDYVRAFARRFGLDDDAAADVAEGVIADLWRRRAIASYAGRSALRTWLGALVTNAALNERARDRRAAAGALAAAREGSDRGDETAVVQPDPDSAGLAAVLAAALHDAFARLAPADRLLARFYYGDGLTLAEIGAIERASKATMSRALQRIRGALRADIERSLAARRITWAEIRAAVDLARMDLDLRALFDTGAEPEAGGVV